MPTSLTAMSDWFWKINLIYDTNLYHHTHISYEQIILIGGKGNCAATWSMLIDSLLFC